MDQKLQFFFKLLNLIDMSFTNNAFAISFPENYVKEFDVSYWLFRWILRTCSINNELTLREKVEWFFTFYGSYKIELITCFKQKIFTKNDKTKTKRHIEANAHCLTYGKRTL